MRRRIVPREESLAERLDTLGGIEEARNTTATGMVPVQVRVVKVRFVFKHTRALVGREMRTPCQGMPEAKQIAPHAVVANNGRDPQGAPGT